MTYTEELTYTYFFFTDIVGLSNPRIPTKRQIQKIEGLTSLIAKCDTFKNTDPNLILYLPTGDGMAIGFLSGPELPFMLAVELHKKLQTYNKGKFPEEALRIRIGISDGPVYTIKSVSDSINLWGPGILLARTVMDIGDDNHILLSSHTAEVLRESDEYRDLIKPVHDYKMKNGKPLLLYSAYGDGIGNSEMPKNSLYQRRKINMQTKRMKTKIVYNNIETALTITDPSTMLAHHKKFYNIENISDKLIQTILHGIGTDVPKTFNDLNIKVTDEYGRELKITSINFDKPYQKEFTTKFNKPIYKGEKDRSYTLEYDVEEPERYFENYFAINCKKYTMSLVYPLKAGFKPIVYDVKVGKEAKTKSKTQPTVKEIEDGLVKATWTRTNMLENQAFRLEW